MFAYEPTIELMPYVYGLALLMTGIGALTDYRTGHIPNWLTLPPLVIAPLAYGLAFGWEACLGCLLGIVLCGLVPLIMFYMNGMAGGDVKLFAAIAAIVGPDLGLQAELLALVVAGIYSLGRLAWEGSLFRTLGNVAMMSLNPILPKRLRRPMSPELRNTLRLGGAIFAGLLITLLGRVRGASENLRPLHPRNDMKKSLLRDTGGAVYVEFLLAFIPLFFMFLGMLQMGLLYGASLVVQHSANVAIRAGMVVWDDDPQYYDGADRRTIGSASSISSFANQAGNLIGRFFGGGGGSGPAPTGGARQQAIEFAAGMPLLPLSPSASSLIRLPRDESVRGALGMSGLDSPEARVAWGIIYNRMAMRVTWPTAVGQSGNYHTDFPAPDASGDAGQMIARVTYLYNCQIPLANRLMCDDLFYIQTGLQAQAVAALAQQFAAGDLTVQQFQDAMAAMQARDQRRSRWAPRMAELGDSVNVLALAAGVSALAGGPTPRFVPITAEASMPFQAANYRYHGGSDSIGWEQQ